MQENLQTHLHNRVRNFGAAAKVRMLLALLLFCAPLVPGLARAAEPIKVGMTMALTGGVAPIGKQVLAALTIWRDDVNAKGGLLGRPVQLVYYDDQSNPANIPGLYTKLIDVDKVDLLIGPYATNMVAPAIPVLMQHNKATIGILANAANSKFHYKQYFSMLPTGPEPQKSFAYGFFQLAAAQKPRPKTVVIVAADAEFAQNAADGARQSIKEIGGFDLLADQKYPPSTTDYAPIMHAVQALHPDILYVAAYPPDSVGIVRAANEVGLTPKMFGGTLIGLLVTPIKVQLGPLMNGIVNNEVFCLRQPLPSRAHSMCLPNTVPSPSANISIRLAGRSRRSAMRPARYWPRRSKAQRPSIRSNWPPTCTRTHSRPWSAPSASARTASGPNRASCSRSSSTSPAIRWTTSRIPVMKSVVWPDEYKSGKLIYPYADARKP